MTGGRENERARAVFLERISDCGSRLKIRRDDKGEEQLHSLSF